jgi:hypothetical protein
MTAPAMPSPAKLIAKSLAYLRNEGYADADARLITKVVIVSFAADDSDWPPWAITWWRKLWMEANGTGTNARTSNKETGKVSDGN